MLALSQELQTCQRVYFYTTVRLKVIAIEIFTFYNYFNQAQNRLPVEISGLFCDSLKWIQKVKNFVALAFWQIVVRKFASEQVIEVLAFTYILFHIILCLSSPEMYPFIGS